MTTVAWSFSAIADLQEIRRYIAGFNPAAAERVAEQIVNAALSLAAFPHRGALVGENLREIMPVYPYLLRYRISGDEVRIIRVRHGMRRQ